MWQLNSSTLPSFVPSDMISRHTRDGAFLYVSPACKNVLGYEPDELLGAPVARFVSDGDATELKAIFGDHPIDGLFELRHADGLLVAPRRQDSALIDQIGQIGTREARRDFADDIQVDRLVERFSFRVHFEDGLPTIDVRCGQDNLAVEATRPQQRLL